jgi:hypothetical protein
MNIIAHPSANGSRATDHNIDSPVDSSKRLHWYPCYYVDFLLETRGWSMAAQGVYYALLAEQWDKGILPAKPEELRTQIGVTNTREWKDGWEKCEPKFPVGRDGRRNLRLEELRSEAEEITRKRVVAGRLGGQAKAANRLANGVAKPLANG